MAQTIVTYCDIHLSWEPEENVPARTYEFATREPGGRFEFVSVDLCPDCAKPVTDALAQLAELGRPFNPGNAGVPVPAAPKPKPADTGTGMKCPVCGNHYQNRGSLRSHLNNVHGVRIGDVKPGMIPKTDNPCPECDFVAENRQGLAAHARSVHGLTLAEVDARSAASA